MLDRVVDILIAAGVRGFGRSVLLWWRLAPLTLLLLLLLPGVAAIGLLLSILRLLAILRLLTIALLLLAVLRLLSIPCSA